MYRAVHVWLRMCWSILTRNNWYMLFLCASVIGWSCFLYTVRTPQHITHMMGYMHCTNPFMGWELTNTLPDKHNLHTVIYGICVRAVGCGLHIIISYSYVQREVYAYMFTPSKGRVCSVSRMRVYELILICPCLYPERVEHACRWLPNTGCNSRWTYHGLRESPVSKRPETGITHMCATCTYTPCKGGCVWCIARVRVLCTDLN